MDTNFLILACVMLLVAVVVLVVVLRPGQNNYAPRSKCKEEKKHVEFSKVIMEVMLVVWVLSSLVGFWVILFRDQAVLMDVLGFIQTTVTVVAGGYYAKSGAENWKKLSALPSQEEDNLDEQRTTNMDFSEEQRGE